MLDNKARAPEVVIEIARLRNAAKEKIRRGPMYETYAQHVKLLSHGHEEKLHFWQQSSGYLCGTFVQAMQGWARGSMQL